MVEKRRDANLRVLFADLGEGEPGPDVAVFAIARDGKLLHRSEARDDGAFDLPAKVLRAAHEVVVAPAGARDLEGLEREALSRFRIREVRELVEAGAPLEIARSRWRELLHFRRCVDGSVTACRPFPGFLDELLVREARFTSKVFERGAAGPFEPEAELDARTLAEASDAVLAAARPAFTLRRCDVVCDGVVEVYRRRCCCEPWVIEDPRLEDLLRRLEELLKQRPKIRWPPPPPPPDPIFDEQIFLGGLLNEPMVHAERDVHALRSLQGPQLAHYVETREYLRPLWCDCGPAAKVGQGQIRPDGSFHVCWGEPLWYLRANCHDEYAFVVKQSFGGSTNTIYDGLAANRWFHDRSGIRLVSYDSRARGCRDNVFPESGAFALLEDIGAAASYRLKSPVQDTWDGVQGPLAYNDGLLDPAANAAAAEGQYLDRNWGGTLALQYHFSEPLRNAPAGAAFYRISVVRADAAGNPTGPRTYLDDGRSWLYYDGTDIQATALGPLTVGGTPNLYRIPYDADRDWQSGQYHGFVDTTKFANERHLITLELFDAAGNQVKPNGAPGPGNDAAFTFRRWVMPTGPTANVPQAALTHLLWWDNRPAYARIFDLRKDDAPSSDECQFLVGPNGAKFSTGYRAYHQNPMFIVRHAVWWRRGLGGPSDTLIESPHNAGQPPAPLAVTPPVTFESMLTKPPVPPGMHMKCSFSLNLHVNVKTTNGSGTLSYLDAYDQAAFALERTGP